MKKIISYAVVFAMGLTMVSCDDFLNDNRFPPTSILEKPEYWSNANNCQLQVDRYIDELSSGYGSGNSLGSFYFSTLSDDQKIQYAASIAGQEAMSGLLAIMNASEGDFEKVANAIDHADGSAEKMAKTRMDNLAGDVETLDAVGIDRSLGKPFGTRLLLRLGVEHLHEVASDDLTLLLRVGNASEVGKELL